VSDGENKKRCHRYKPSQKLNPEQAEAGSIAALTTPAHTVACTVLDTTDNCSFCGPLTLDITLFNIIITL